MVSVLFSGFHFGTGINSLFESAHWSFSCPGGTMVCTPRGADSEIWMLFDRPIDRWQIREHVVTLPHWLKILDYGTGPKAWIRFEALSDFMPLPMMGLCLEEKSLAFKLETVIQITNLVQAEQGQGITHACLRPEFVFLHVDNHEVRLMSPIPIPENGSCSQARWQCPNTQISEAPEWVLGMSEASTAVFGIGLVLHYFLTTQYPTYDVMGGIHFAYDREDIPPQLRRMIDKMMAYDRADRYATLDSLAMDMAQCLETLCQSGKVPYFALDSLPCSEQLVQYHCGILAYRKELDLAWQNVKTGMSQVTLVNGDPGVGKTVTVRNYLEGCGEAWCAYGKCTSLPDQLYQALFTILSKLHLHASGDSRFEQFSSQYHQFLDSAGLVLSDSGGIMTRGSDDENNSELTYQHFHRSILQLIQVCAELNPVVIVFDDVQWADTGTLAIIEDLILQYPTSAIWVILMYRSNEIEEPLAQFLERIKDKKGGISPLSILPFGPETLSEFLADFFQLSHADGRLEVVKQILAKTGGVPFFVKQFMLDQIQNRILVFESPQQKWSWDLVLLEETPVMDNAAHLIASKLHQCPPETQTLLEIASCMGFVFSMEILAKVSGKQPTQVALSLWPAIRAHFISPLEEVGYQFLHDTIHHAFYQQQSDAIRHLYHFKIAQAMEAHPEKYSVFERANQYNGADPTNWDELLCYRIAELNMESGLQALQKANFQAAVSYLQKANALTSTFDWGTHYALKFPLRLHLGQALLLDGAEAEATLVLDECEGKAVDATDALKSVIARIEILHHLDRQFEAAHLGIRAASRYGLKTPPQWMGNVHILLELFKFRLLAKKSFPSINTVLSDLETRYHHLLLTLSAILYFTDAQAFAWHSLYALNWTCQSGFSAFSPGIMASGAIILFHGLKQYEAAIEISERALSLAEHFKNPHVNTTAYFILGAFILPYYRPFPDIFDTLQQSIKLGSTAGNIVYANYSQNYICFYQFLSGKHLSALEEQLYSHLHFSQKTHEKWSEYHAIGFIRLVQNLTQKNETLMSSLQREFVWESREERLKNNKKFLILMIDRVFESLPFFLKGDFKRTQIIIEGANDYLHYGLGMFHTLILEWVYALSSLACFSDCSISHRRRIRKRVSKTATQFQAMAKLCPFNFQAMSMILEIQVQSVLKRKTIAEWQYRRCIDLAIQGNFLMTAIVATDFAARNLQGTESDMFRNEWKLLCLKWGATGLV